MKQFLKSVKLWWLVWALVVAICVALGVKQTHHLLSRDLIPDTALREQAIAALIGSVFGALLGSIATTFGIVVTDKLRERRNRDHERRTMHYNCVVRLQRQMNTTRATMEDNVHAIKSILGAIDAGLPTFQRPIVIETDETPFKDLYDLTLINMLSDLYYEIRRLNLDTVNLTRALDALDELLMSGKITPVEYKREMTVIKPNVDKVRQLILNKIDHDVMDVIAYVRICTDRDASQEMKKRFKRVQKGRQPIKQSELKEVRKIIERELDASEAAGNKEKDEMSQL